MTATPDPTGDVRELLMVQNGAVVRIDGYCNVGPDSIQCFEHGVEDWRSEGGYDWITYPLPPGDLLYVPPNGMWIVADGSAIPVDESAAQYETGTIPVSDVQALVLRSEPDYATWFLAVALTAITAVVLSVALWRHSRRARA